MLCLMSEDEKRAQNGSLICATELDVPVKCFRLNSPRLPEFLYLLRCIPKHIFIDDFIGCS